MSFLNPIARRVFTNGLRSSATALTHSPPMEAELTRKPLSKFKKSAYQIEAKWQLLNRKTPDKDRFNSIKERLDQDHVVLNMAKTKVANRDWSGLNLAGINFEESRLTNVQARNSRMDGCQLTRTHATNCDFSDTTLTQAEAECFHGKTSTFNGATLGGNWSRSDLPVAVRERSNVTVTHDAQLKGVFYPEPSWQMLRDVMERTGNANLIQVRQTLLAHAKARAGTTSLGVTASHTANPWAALTSPSTACEQLETIVEACENQVPTLPTQSPARLQNRNSNRQHSSSLAPVSAKPSSVPRPANEANALLPQRGFNHSVPVQSPHTYRQVANMAEGLGYQRLVDKRFSFQEAHALLRKGKNILSSLTRKSNKIDTTYCPESLMLEQIEPLIPKDTAY